jgi:hypothetical protein
VVPTIYEPWRTGYARRGREIERGQRSRQGCVPGERRERERERREEKGERSGTMNKKEGLRGREEDRSERASEKDTL